jgi:beta-glucanase (GH16 family)
MRKSVIVFGVKTLPQRILIVVSLLGSAAVAQSPYGLSTSGHGTLTQVAVCNASQDTSPGSSSGVAPVIAPTFSDAFSGGTLDKTKWFIDTGNAPGKIDGVNQGTLSAENVDLSTGMLRLTLTQSVSGALATSVGAEIRSKQLFGYGAYAWVARAASTSATPKGAGSAVSGTVTDVFNFINNSETEIDFEYEGQFPSTLEMTNYSTVSKSHSTSATVPGADSTFHEYKFIWTAAKIEFYVDRTLVSTHTQHIPSAPAAALINIWGTNSKAFGGVATQGLTRYLYVSSFSYTPHSCQGRE